MCFFVLFCCLFVVCLFFTDGQLHNFCETALFHAESLQNILAIKNNSLILLSIKQISSSRNMTLPSGQQMHVSGDVHVTLQHPCIL